MATVAPAQSAPRGWRLWAAAARPRTLWAGAAPVAVGTAVAVGEGGFRAGPAIAALAGALLLQIASNLANDVYDHERGADGDDRLGPPRATQMGWISAGAMKRATFGVLALAAAVGMFLVVEAGWPVLVAGLLSIWAAWAYTGGPWPLGYHGLGEVAVAVFFGLVAVTGTTYVQTLTWSPTALAASVPIGALASAILAVNNLRDLDTDASVGKRTVAVRLGRKGARAEYAGLLALAYVWPWAAIALGVAPWSVVVVWLSLPLAWSLVRSVGSLDGVALNPMLGGTARLLAVYGGLLALGLAASRLGSGS